MSLYSLHKFATTGWSILVGNSTETTTEAELELQMAQFVLTERFMNFLHRMADTNGTLTAKATTGRFLDRVLATDIGSTTPENTPTVHMTVTIRTVKHAMARCLVAHARLARSVFALTNPGFTASFTPDLFGVAFSPRSIMSLSFLVGAGEDPRVGRVDTVGSVCSTAILSNRNATTQDEKSD